MREIIFRLLEKPDTSIVMSSSPNRINESLNDLGWDIVQDYLAESREDWSCTEYVSEYCSDFKITMQWNGWTGQVELVATHMEEEDPLMKGLRKVLLTTHNVVEYQNYDFVEISTFIENKGWKLYKATATFQPGWCHYIYSNDKYLDRRLVLACDLEHKITTLWTISSDLMEDK